MTKPSSNTPLAFDSLTKEQFDKEISKGIADIDNNRIYSSEETEAFLMHHRLNTTQLTEILSCKPTASPGNEASAFISAENYN